MRRSPHRASLLTRATLAVALTFGAVGVTGCEDENDPATWVRKLGDSAKRTGAMVRLHQIFDGIARTTNPPQNMRDPRIRAFLDAALPQIVTAFTNNREDTVMRREAIEILAASQDPRAVPALLSALNFQAGSQDSERVALRAAQALKELAPNLTGGDRTQVSTGLLQALQRLTTNAAGANSRQLRYHIIGGLGALRATEATQALADLLLRPVAEQDIDTARAAAVALGDIGDGRAADALVYGLYLNINRQNVFPHCVRALGQLGAAAAVPKLIETLNGQNARVTALMQQYAQMANAPPIPPGLTEMQAADVLRVFADPTAVAPLLARLNDRNGNESVRAAAAEALAYTAIAIPAQRTTILQAITAAFSEQRDPGDAGWSAQTFASKLALIGDASSIPLLLTALRNSHIQGPEHAPTRMGMLLPLASILRHDNVAAFDQLSGAVRTQLQATLHDNPEMAREINAMFTQLDTLNNVASVARDCPDGDVACYLTKLRTNTPEVIRKAAYMLAWTTPEAQREQARTALLERVPAVSDVLVRRTLMFAIEALSPQGFPEALTRLQAMIESERNQESKILSHLDAMLLMGRLRVRAITAGAAPAAH